MLQELHISNYALIDNIDITFGRGLNVITGETGAGKSIIMGALSLILGGRADSRVMADVNRKSVVEAIFDVSRYPEVKRFCSANDLDFASDTDAQLIMRREITASGRSRAFINDTPVTVSKMRELAIHLVDIHSQHQNLLLAQSDFQREIIDRLADNKAVSAEYSTRYTTLREALRSLKRMKSAIEKSHEDEEFMRFQLSQLDALDPQEGEMEELERERDLQANLTEVKQSLLKAVNALRDDEINIFSLLDNVSESTDELEGYIDGKADLAGRLEAVRIELQDIAETFASINDNLDADPASLEAIDERLSSLNSMLRRHHADSVDQLIELRTSLRKRLALVEDGDEKVAALEKTVRRALTLARESAASLTASRSAAAERLGAELKKRAVPLGMKNLECEIRVAEGDLTSHGADTVDFLFAFNKNQPLVPVGETASGGEISRLMLSIKAIVAEHIQLPSLILDEIDTGVSGDVAARMGELMLSIGQYSQVIVITHLPQVAAKGANHYKVYKEDDEEATHTRIRRLNPDERISEIALMLSGNPDDQSAQATAMKMIDK